MDLKKTLLLFGLTVVFATSGHAVSINGAIGADEYAYSTDTSNPLWNTDGTSTNEAHDGSYNHRWDIDFLGFDIDNDANTFSVGIKGGEIVGGSSGSQYLGDLAIGIVTDTNLFDPNTAFDPGGTFDFQYGIRLYADNGDLELKFYDVDSWDGADIYNGQHASNIPSDPHDHITNTYKLNSSSSGDAALSSATSSNGLTGKHQTNVLEGSFDLSLLSLFNELTGGKIITYLTMSCVNDEAMVHADISAVPIPSAVWLFGSALVGFIGFSRRTSV